MTKELQIYKCEICGNIVEVLHSGAGELVCCGEPMKLLSENTTDAAQEKHVPVIEKTDKGIKVKVGSAAHPMEEKHYIEWVQIIFRDGRSSRQFLKPGMHLKRCLNAAMKPLQHGNTATFMGSGRSTDAGRNYD